MLEIINYANVEYKNFQKFHIQISDVWKVLMNVVFIVLWSIKF